MKLRLIRIIAIAILAVSGFLVTGLLELFGRAQNENAVAVPKQANWVLRVDAATLLKEEAFTVLFEERDEQLLKTIRTLAENSLQQEKKPKLFVNIFSEMVVFGTKKDGNSFTGILVQLERPELFEKNVPQYLDANQAFAVKGSTGLILIKNGTGQLSRQSQQQFAQSLLDDSSETFLTARKRKSNEYVRLEIKDEAGELKSADIGVFFDRSVISLAGELEITEKVKMPRFDVKHENFYVNSAFVPQNLPEMVMNAMQLGKLEFPPLENLSFNYSGIILENSTAIFRLPKINAVLTAKNPVKVADLLAQVPEEFRTTGNRIRFSHTVYHLVQLDSKTIFFGIDPSSVVRSAPESPLIISGDLQKVAAIEADGMIMAGVSMLVPQYNSFNSFTKETEKAELKLISAGNHRYKAEGQLKFRDERSALAAITRLILGVQSGN